MATTLPSSCDGRRWRFRSKRCQAPFLHQPRHLAGASPNTGQIFCEPCRIQDLSCGLWFALAGRMPRRTTILQSEFPYSVTARSNNREWFDLPPEVCWHIFETEILETMERYGLQTHSFVMMSNHFHWLLSTPDSNLSTAMRYFQTETSRKLARASKRINAIYGGRYKWSVIGSAGYYANTIRYFYQNPLRAKICRDIDQYPWTTRSARSRIRLSTPEGMQTYIPDEPENLRQWLNTIPPGPYAEMMRKALRRPEFQFPKHPTKKKALAPTTFLESSQSFRPVLFTWDDAAGGEKVPGTL